MRTVFIYDMRLQMMLTPKHCATPEKAQEMAEKMRLHAAERGWNWDVYVGGREDVELTWEDMKVAA
jgi:hypothetical protein